MTFDILEKLREQIDNIDNEIMILIKRRLQTSKKVAEYKFKNEMEVFDEQREMEIIKDKSSRASAMKLDDAFVREIFEILIEESKKEQEKYLQKEAEKQTRRR